MPEWLDKFKNFAKTSWNEAKETWKTGKDTAERNWDAQRSAAYNDPRGQNSVISALKRGDESTFLDYQNYLDVMKNDPEHRHHEFAKNYGQPSSSGAAIGTAGMQFGGRVKGVGGWSGKTVPGMRHGGMKK